MEEVLSYAALLFCLHVTRKSRKKTGAYETLKGA